MKYRLPPLRLTGATILRDNELQDRSLAIADGRITKGSYRAVDLSGYYILPGIIDLHGDVIDRHMAPDATSPQSMMAGLAGVDRDAAANGVTTAWVAQHWSWQGGRHGPDTAEAMLQARDAYATDAMTDLRVQLRFETHTFDSTDRLLRAVRQHRVDYVMFQNSLDKALLMKDIDPDGFATKARALGWPPIEYGQIVNEARKRDQEVPRRLCKMAEAFDLMKTIYGSHNDPDGETREMYAMLGARICEIPTTFSAASVARAVGDPVLMGAPDVLRKATQTGHVSAMSLIKASKCDALVSQSFYPALSQAAFALVDQNLKSLPAAWRMISQTPASILRLTDRGIIDIGKRADLAIVNKTTRRVEATISNGRLSHLFGEAAYRFVSGQTINSMAAE
ncbi:alpha-D-ribose 1-methylphosphonate 5-triphosphate diphosphatase [Aestuariibius sp. HNIBRBA575]|uniref:alpha-D-ribose 1-methylphosphonate 5-triphosphate diphosphatase n=1 Tax=Aestuariibius sp. HNIBRBA575 TaxID=3233343 RepID=UPI0034A140E5